MKLRSDLIVAVGTLAILAGSTVSAQSRGTHSSQGTHQPAASDKMFMTKAAMGGEAEVDLGTLAQLKTVDPKVKAFAERMVNDHSKANAELRQIMTSKGLTVAGGLPKDAQALKARLEKLDGVNFDQTYAAAMVDDHVKDIKEFEMAAKSADPDVKHFAEKALPTLRDHLKMAQDMKASVGVPRTAGRAPAASTKSAAPKSGTSARGARY